MESLKFYLNKTQTFFEHKIPYKIKYESQPTKQESV
jgi:hypothetical protein